MLEQESAYVVVAVRAPNVWLPEVDFAPLQPPAAAQAVALALDQDNTELPPEAMAVGLAFRVTVGVGGGGGGGELLATATLSDFTIEPLLPTQLSENVALALSGPTT